MMWRMILGMSLPDLWTNNVICLIYDFDKIAQPRYCFYNFMKVNIYLDIITILLNSYLIIFY